jgi:hypothetical protein
MRDRLITALVIGLVALVIIGTAVWVLAIEAQRNEAIGYCKAIELQAIESADPGRYLCIEGVLVP